MSWASAPNLLRPLVAVDRRYNASSIEGAYSRLGGSVRRFSIKNYLLAPNTVFNFQRSDIYKHYFFLFSQQVAALPPVPQRAEYLRERVVEALALYEQIEMSGVFLDSDSN